MEMDLRDRFTALWTKYFGDAELPICLSCSDVESCGRSSRHVKAGS
jgi:hypothetical protein